LTARRGDSFSDKSVTGTFARSLQMTGVCAAHGDPARPPRSPPVRIGRRTFGKPQERHGEREAPPRRRTLRAWPGRIIAQFAPVTFRRDADDISMACNMCAPARTGR